MTTSCAQLTSQCRSISVKLQLEVVEVFNKLCRFQEEEKLVLRAMKSYLEYYKETIQKLKNDILGKYTVKVVLDISTCIYHSLYM